MESEKFYMNLLTGSVDTADAWIYTDEDGLTHDPLKSGEVVEVVKDTDGNWIEANA